MGTGKIYLRPRSRSQSQSRKPLSKAGHALLAWGCLHLVGPRALSHTGTSGTSTVKRRRRPLPCRVLRPAEVPAETMIQVPRLGRPHCRRAAYLQVRGVPLAGWIPYLAANDKAKASLTARGRPSGNGSDVVWCTLRSTLMLLSAKSSPWLPYGFIHMGRLEVQSSDPVTHCVTLNVSGEPLKGDSGHGGERGAHCDGNTSMENVPPPPVQLIFLLPDGRWQVVEQPCLKLQLSNADELKRWTDAFPAHCSPAANKRPPKNVAAATLATTSM